MAKQNTVFLYGFVEKLPVVYKDKEGNASHGVMVIDTVRSLRKVGDNLHFTKHDHPLIISRDSEIMEKMKKLKEFDIVFIKGVISSTSINKSSYCPKCGERNIAKGNCVYVTPIFVEKLTNCKDKEAATDYIIERMEVSNQVYLCGTLVNEPKIFTTLNGKQITQYPIVSERKYTIKTDDPLVKTDYPIIKSYGEQARNDKMYLRPGSEVLIDGGLQARTIERTTKCCKCGEFYHWNDTAMEVITYAVEYLRNFKTNEEVEKEHQMDIEAYRQMLFGQSDSLPEDLKSNDLKK